MNPTKPILALKPDTLSKKNLHKLKWCTTIAILGIPVLVQILGAIILFSSQYSVLTSLPVLALFAGACLFVIGCGIYALTNRVFLHFSFSGKELQEWESKTQKDAFAFSYRMIVKGVLLLFIGVSILGAIQSLFVMGWIDSNFGRSIVLNIEAIAAISVALTYLTLLLPTLYIAWTLPPLNDSEGELF